MFLLRFMFAVHCFGGLFFKVFCSCGALRN
uniref:Uncharacterized protein n=1 Tax=Arundo donax TaxID=35708 RepID=A0A0A9C5G2_ARUDO